VATPLGTMAAYGLFVSNFRIANIVFMILIAPIMIPVILIAIGAFYAYVKLNLVNSIIGLVMGYAILAIPLVVIVVSSALKSYDMNQEMAALSLGASRLNAFVVITLPQIRFSLISAGVLSFLTSFDEVIIAMFVSGGDNSTLTRNMFNALRNQIDPTIASISTIMVVVTSILMAVSQLFGKFRVN
jgi:putative spermidine/putrescine transport system permease protein